MLMHEREGDRSLVVPTASETKFHNTFLKWLQLAEIAAGAITLSNFLYQWD
jgi:hypothetical protein